MLTEIMAVCFLVGIVLMALAAVCAVLFALRNKSCGNKYADRQYKETQAFIQNGFYKATGDILRETARSSLIDRINRL